MKNTNNTKLTMENLEKVNGGAFINEIPTNSVTGAPMTTNPVNTPATAQCPTNYANGGGRVSPDYTKQLTADKK